MSWKQYKNELVVLFAFVLMVGAILYKNGQISFQKRYAENTSRVAGDLKSIVALKKIWSDSKVPQKVKRFKELIPLSKMKWSNKNKRVSVSYSSLNARELNKLITAILNLPVEINMLKMEKRDLFYDVEFKCKW